jgi:dTDP-4-amino-4,6-dideoxygalactose transaminase
MKKRFEFNLQYPKPLLENELDQLISIAKSGLFSRYTGHIVDELEEELASYYQTEYAVTCTSGTAALHGCLVSLDFPQGSEIITTSVADIGIVIPIMYENLVPVFADIDLQTYNITAKNVEQKITKKTKAVIAVHLAGNPCDLDSLVDLCEKHKIMLIEDFSQAHGAKWNGKKVGSYGQISYGSFQQSKQITCGEGGVIVTNDKELHRRAFIGVDKAWQRHLPLEERFYEFLAPNVRFNALQAAVLKPQLKRLDSLIERKRSIAKKLCQNIAYLSEYVKPQKIYSSSFHSYYSFPLFVTDNEFRNNLVDLLEHKYNMYCARGYANPVPLYQCVNPLIDPGEYGKNFTYSNQKYPEGTCPNAEALLKRSFLIPFNENYTDEEVLDISNRLSSAISECIV